jgi:hypothetical protein
VTRRTTLPAAAVLLAALLLATPALAAPNLDTGPALQLRALVAEWWSGVAALFGRSTHILDPDGQPASTSGDSRETLDPDGAPAAQSGDDPTASPQSRETIDPNG